MFTRSWRKEGCLSLRWEVMVMLRVRNFIPNIPVSAECILYDLGVRDALHDALRKRGMDPVARDPWFFPTPDQYMGLLRSACLDPLRASLHRRATPFADLAAWIRLFGTKFLEGIDPDDEQELVNEVVARCRESGVCNWDEEKKLWYLDYVRLRVVAVKEGGHGDM